MVVKLADLRRPVELWNALDGDVSAFVAKLRSDEPLTRPERDCLAWWLENNCKPPKRPRGRPSVKLGISLFPSTRIEWAAWRYRRLWCFIRRKGWHRKRAGKFYWSHNRLLTAIADRYGVDHRSLENSLRRRRRKLEKPRLDFIAAWVEDRSRNRSKK